MNNEELNQLRDHYDKSMVLAHEWGMDPFPIDFHVVPAEKIYEIASYGVPGHFSHWSFGRDFYFQKAHYDRGLSRIYELIINANPAQAFLLENNSLTSNLLVVSHCLGHCFLPGTLISTVEGVKHIEDLSQRDNVYNVWAEKVNCEPTTRFYKGPIVNIVSGGLTFACTPEHRFLAVDLTQEDRKGCGSWEGAISILANTSCRPMIWAKAEDLTENSFLVVNIPKLPDQPIKKFAKVGFIENKHAGGRKVDRDSIMDYLYKAEGPVTLQALSEDLDLDSKPLSSVLSQMRKANNIISPKRGEYLIGSNRWSAAGKQPFTLPLNEEVGELVGFYLSEGYTSTNNNNIGFCFHIDEKEYRDKVSFLLGKYFNVVPTEALIPEKKSGNLIFGSKQYAAFFRQFGQGSHNKHLPLDWIDTCPREFYLGLLRTFLQGNGHDDGAVVSYSTTSPLLVQQIHRIGLYFDLFFHVNERSRSQNGGVRRKIAYEGYVSGGAYSLRFLTNIRKNLRPVRNPNRSWTFAVKKGDKFFVKVSKIHQGIYEGPVYCANVQDGSSFTLGNQIITHNSDFFSRSIHFAHTNRDIEQTVGAFAERVRQYEIQYGRYVVEEFIDDVMTISEHIDPHLRTQKKTSAYEMAYKNDPYEDLFPEREDEQKVRELEEENRKRYKFPYQPERDLMKFIAENGRLDDWQRDIMLGMREESIYFLPQYGTKSINEGYSSLIHRAMMHKIDPESDVGGIEFAQLHSGVLSAHPSLRLNPYWLGYNILMQIIKVYGEHTDREMDELAFLEDGGSEGWKKLLEVIEIDNDESLIRNYLDEETCEKLDLFAYGFDEEEKHWSITDKGWEKVRDILAHNYSNMGRPYITVEDADYDRHGVLYLKHHFDGRVLKKKYTTGTMSALARLWGNGVRLDTIEVDEAGQEKKLTVVSGDR